MPSNNSTYHRKLSFPNPCYGQTGAADAEELKGEADAGGEEMIWDGAPPAQAEDDDLLASPLSPAAAAAIAARIASHPLLQQKVRRMLLFALRSTNNESSDHVRSTPLNMHAWTGRSLGAAWSASHRKDAASGVYASSALRDGVQVGLFCSSAIRGVPGRPRAFMFPNPNFGGGGNAAADSDAPATAETAGCCGGIFEWVKII